MKLLLEGPAYQRLIRLGRLPSPQRKLLLDAFKLLLIVRLGLWLLPLPKVRRIVRRVRPHSGLGLAATHVVWAITTASHFVPGATCLVRAVATQVLLAWNGQQAQLIIGVALDDKEKFQAHAWVECDGEICMGHHSTHYVQMLAFDSD